MGVPWLIVGESGQLGRHTIARLRAAGIEFVAPTLDEFDMTDPAACEALVAEHDPDILLNAAAYTAVDAAEDNEGLADAINHLGTGYLAQALATRHGRMITVSTDYVFPGTFVGEQTRPYEVDDPTDPQGAYGRTKLAGEQAVRAALPDRSHIVRTAWLYGGPSPNFVDTMLRLERERETITVVADQFGCPTWVDDLARGVLELAATDLATVPAGILHYVNAGKASWHEFAQEVFRLRGADPERVRPCSTEEYPVKAKRPAWSVLSTAAWTGYGLTAPRPWRDALADCLHAR